MTRIWLAAADADARSYCDTHHVSRIIFVPIMLLEPPTHLRKKERLQLVRDVSEDGVLGLSKLVEQRKPGFAENQT